MMAPAYRLTVLAIGTAMALEMGLFGAARGHDGPHDGRSRTATQIDPRVAYSARLVAAGGGHFHSILLGPEERWILAGTHLGLFRSVDRGLTWKLVASRFSAVDVHGLVMDPATGRVRAATHGQGLVTSADEGRTWTDDSAGLPTRDLHALALDPRQPDNVYVWAVGHGLLARAGSEARWQRLVSADRLGDVRALAVHPKADRRLYAATAKGVWVSRDGGRSWEQPPDGLRTPAAGIALPMSGGLLIAATDAGVFFGDAMASRWRRIDPAPEWWGPLIAFAFTPDGREAIAVSHEGIVARRPFDGSEWMPLTEAPPSRHVERRR